MTDTQDRPIIGQVTEPPELETEPPAQTDHLDNVPNNANDAERALLGSILLSPKALAEVMPQLSGADFYRPAHETIYDAAHHLHATGRPVDAITVLDQLETTGDMKRAGGAAYLHDLIAALPTSANAGYYVHIIQQARLRRRLQEAATRITQLADGTDTIRALTKATLEITEVRNLAVTTGRHLEQDTAPDVDTYLAQAEGDEYDWLIPGVLERQDRLIITAGEGHGKSTLLRQLAVQAATGIHPFTGHTMPPVRVLVVDLENSDRQTRRKIRPLRIAAGQNLNPDQLHIVCRVQGLDLTNPDDQQWLDNLTTANTPDLLITGPIYKLAGGNPNDEKDAKPAAMAIDALRARHDIAVILEAHSAKTPAGTKPINRPKEPFGWSGWMRWPEFGLHLAEDGTLTHWRGPRDERDWPDTLKRGGRWPWTPATATETDPTARWGQIHAAIVMAGRRLSHRELMDSTGFSKGTVQRLLEAHESDVNRLYSEIEGA